MTLEIFDCIINGLKDDADLIDILNGFVWCELETTYQSKPAHARFMFSKDGIGVWYDYGADYHFFTHEG